MIRKACTGDESRIAEILIFAKRAAYRPIFKDDRVSFGELQVVPLAMQFIENPSLLESIMIYEEDGIVKGIANTRHVQECGREVTEVVELYIDPFFQHEGVGGKLLGEVASSNELAGIEETFLWVLEKNSRAIQFYKKHGFVPTGERKPVEGTPEYVTKFIKSVKVSQR